MGAWISACDFGSQVDQTAVAAHHPSKLKNLNLVMSEKHEKHMKNSPGSDPKWVGQIWTFFSGTPNDPVR
jgi:hypothetical protein